MLFRSKLMVDNTRLLEKSLGDGIKKVEKNEIKSSIIQRRGVWLIRDKKKNTILNRKDIVCLRPSPKNSISPFEIEKYIGKKFIKNLKKNRLLTIECLS